MADFTSVTDGDWNDGATWGLTSPGTKGTHWPGLAGDTAYISVGDTVSYNVSETNEMGNIDVYGTLNFLYSMSTLLTMGHNTLYIRDGGELTIGTPTNPIGSSYTAKLLWNPTANYATHFSWDGDGKLTIEGDPDWYGNKPTAYLQSAWTTGQTFTVNGDYTSSWASGMWVAVCRGGTGSITYTEAGDYFSIASVAANGGNTDITINETAPAVTFAAGADVILLSRNVELGKYQSSGNIFGWQEDTTTLTPGWSHVVDQNDTIITPTNMNSLKHAWWRDWYSFSLPGYCVSAEDVVYSTISGLGDLGHNVQTGATLKDIYIVGCGDGPNVYLANVENLWVFGCNYAISNGFASTVAGARFYGNNYGIGGTDDLTIQGWMYFQSGYWIYNCYMTDCIVNLEFGYDERGNTYYMTTSSYYAPTGYMTSPINFVDCRMTVDFGISAGRNPNFPRRNHFIFENYDDTEGDLRIYGPHTIDRLVDADNTSGRPDQRVGGSDRVVSVEWDVGNTYSIPLYANLVTMIKHKLWAEEGATKTLRYYIQNATSYALTTANFYMIIRGIGAFARSSESVSVRTSSTDWTQYIEATITPAKSYWICPEIHFAPDTSETDYYVYIDPKLEIR